MTTATPGSATRLRRPGGRRGRAASADGRRCPLRLRPAARRRTRPQARLHRAGRPGSRRTETVPAGVSRRHRHRRQLGQQAVPARRVRRGAAPVRGGGRARPSRCRRLAGRRGRGRGDRAALERTARRRGDLGARTRRLDPQPPDLRRRPAKNRRLSPAGRAGRPLGLARRHDRLRHGASTRSIPRALAALARRPPSRRRAPAGRRSGERSTPRTRARSRRSTR